MTDVRILWLDPDTSALNEHRRAFTKRDWAVDAAGTAQEAMALARNRPYHFAIVDVALPDGMGTEAWTRLRELAPELTGIMTTGSRALWTSIQALSPGILAYLLKPLAMDDISGLIATVCAYPTVADRARHAEMQRLGLAPEIARSRALADRQTIGDRDSGVYSADFLEHVLAMESARQTRDSCPYSLILVNWSGVRQAYEALGPEVAAGALLRWGALASRLVRRSDVVARRRTDEFAILLPHTDYAQAQLVAQRLEAHTASALPDAAQKARPVLKSEVLTYTPTGQERPRGETARAGNE